LVEVVVAEFVAEGAAVDAEEVGGFAALPLAGFENLSEESRFELVEEFGVETVCDRVRSVEFVFDPAFEGLSQGDCNGFGIAGNGIG